MDHHKTQRTFRDVETQEIFCLWMDADTRDFKLISDGSEKFAPGTEVNGFYISAHTGATIKTNQKTTVYLSPGEFYNLKEGEKIIHRKFTGFKNFTKI